MALIDKDQLKAEIERRIKFHYKEGIRVNTDRIDEDEIILTILDSIPEQHKLKPMNIPSAGGGMSTNPPSYKLDVKPEQPAPTIMTKEDEKMRQDLIAYFVGGDVIHNPGLKFYEAAEWLKSLHPHPKQEWSEEDEHRMTDAIYFLESAMKHYADTSEIEKTIAWLKSLRPSWKPSEELKDLPKWKKTKPERGKAFGAGPWYGSGIIHDNGKHVVFFRGYEISVDELFEKLPKED